MNVKRVIVGELEENCYLLEKDGKCIVIDPGDDFFKIQKEIGDLEVLKVFLTHHHSDHIGALPSLLKTYQVDVFDFWNLKEKEYTIGPFNFQVIFTPGHTNDSVSYYFLKEHCMFVGDFVFQGTIGRCDLPTGDFKMMKKSIEKLLQYPDNTKLLPGHGEYTLLIEEKKSNPYFR